MRQVYVVELSSADGIDELIGAGERFFLRVYRTNASPFECGQAAAIGVSSVYPLDRAMQVMGDTIRRDLELSAASPGEILERFRQWLLDENASQSIRHSRKVEAQDLMDGLLVHANLK